MPAINITEIKNKLASNLEELTNLVRPIPRMSPVTRFHHVCKHGDRLIEIRNYFSNNEKYATNIQEKKFWFLIKVIIDYQPTKEEINDPILVTEDAIDNFEERLRDGDITYRVNDSYNENNDNTNNKDIETRDPII